MTSLGKFGRLFYLAVLGILLTLGIMAAWAGWWLYTIVSLVLTVFFVVSAPFVLGRKWRPPAPTPTRRPVVRRKR